MKAEERGVHIGSHQTLCWQLRLLGQLAGLLFGGFSVSVLDWFRGTIFLINGIVPLLFLPSLLMLEDVRPHSRDKYVAASEIGFVGLRKKLDAVWEVMAEPYLWKPMLFVFVYASTPSSSDAFVNFMLLPTSKRGLGITLGEYTWLLAIGQVASIIGAWMYRRCFSAVPWRTLFYSVLLLSIPVALTQFVVIFRWQKFGAGAFISIWV